MSVRSVGTLLLISDSFPFWFISQTNTLRMFHKGHLIGDISSYREKLRDRACEWKLTKLGDKWTYAHAEIKLSRTKTLKNFKTNLNLTQFHLSYGKMGKCYLSFKFLCLYQLSSLAGLYGRRRRHEGLAGTHEGPLLRRSGGWQHLCRDNTDLILWQCRRRAKVTQ